MVENLARAMRRMVPEAAEGDQAVYGHTLRLARDIHEVMQPGKDEGKDGGTVPFGPRFTRPPQATPSSGESGAPAADEPTVIDQHGQAYVDGDR
jgi:hypothetical protein